MCLSCIVVLQKKSNAVTKWEGLIMLAQAITQCSWIINSNSIDYKPLRLRKSKEVVRYSVSTFSLLRDLDLNYICNSQLFLLFNNVLLFLMKMYFYTTSLLLIQGCGHGTCLLIILQGMCFSSTAFYLNAHVLMAQFSAWA